MDNGTILNMIGVFFAHVIAFANVLTNALGRFVVAPVVGLCGGWLSNTIFAGIVGVMALFMFKYTSNQDAIGKVRDNIKAQTLALKLFSDSVSVTLQAQMRLFIGAFSLFFHALRPMLVMIVPVVLILSQMALWYQARPLAVGEESLVTVQLNGDSKSVFYELQMQPNAAFEITTGPVKALANREIFWKVKATRGGDHIIVLRGDGIEVEKKLSVGGGAFRRVSLLRPGQKWSDILLHPLEKPFSSDSPVQSIGIEYPDRNSFLSGTSSWLIYFFVASMVIALIFKPAVKVKM